MGVRIPRERPRQKIPIDMTPMIDVVFQLLIFFMLTLKISARRRGLLDQHAIEPSGKAANSGRSGAQGPLDRQGGRLAGIGGAQRRVVGRRRGGVRGVESPSAGRDRASRGPLSKEIEAELDPDYELRYAEVVRAMTAVTGQVDPATKQVRRYVEKVKIARPRARAPVAECLPENPVALVQQPADARVTCGRPRVFGSVVGAIFEK